MISNGPEACQWSGDEPTATTGRLISLCVLPGFLVNQCMDTVGLRLCRLATTHTGLYATYLLAVPVEVAPSPTGALL